ncbi:hypothetical protein NDU88_001011 [Pleurodeles waltl]|uniref:Uncharacterized protein n=1 Tax=Pleurodeles waltl TaxID=8319 RepID=A0AAV7U6C3_PLEWA|nr:hypothetical protein NDU88_001011 [Pleurodeles waltl]
MVVMLVRISGMSSMQLWNRVGLHLEDEMELVRERWFLDRVLRVSLPCVLEFLHGTRCKNNGEKWLGQCRWRSFLFLDRVLRVSLPCVLEFLHGTRCKNNREKRLGQCRWRSFL